jgi:hypothetical protein
VAPPLSEPVPAPLTDLVQTNQICTPWVEILSSVKATNLHADSVIGKGRFQYYLNGFEVARTGLYGYLKHVVGSFRIEYGYNTVQVYSTLDSGQVVLVHQDIFYQAVFAELVTVFGLSNGSHSHD